LRLAVQQMQILLGVEPKLARAFGRLQKRATDPHLRKFCGEGVTYTNRRVRRLKAALRSLAIKPRAKKSAALPGLIADALAAGVKLPPVARDAALLAAIEPISHYGLAAYTAIDRHLLGAKATKARKILRPCVTEKRDAIIEMLEMGSSLVGALRKGEGTKSRKGK